MSKDMARRQKDPVWIVRDGRIFRRDTSGWQFKLQEYICLAIFIFICVVNL